MAFWKDGNAQPKRNFRFKVEIDGEVWWWAKTCDTPSFDLGEVEVHYLDNKFYYPGRLSWNEINMSVVDPVGEDVTSRVADFLSSLNYSVKADSTKSGTISKVKTVQGSIPDKGGDGSLNLDNTTGLTSGLDVRITIYDAGSGTSGEGAVVEKWTLKNAWVKSAKFGTLDYSNDELKQIDLVFRYDWAELTNASTTLKLAPA